MTLGCSRIDTGWYFSTPFGGRPRLGASSRVAARSPFGRPRLLHSATACAPRRDDAVAIVQLPDSEDDHHDSDNRTRRSAAGAPTDSYIQNREDALTEGLSPGDKKQESAGHDGKWTKAKWLILCPLMSRCCPRTRVRFPPPPLSLCGAKRNRAKDALRSLGEGGPSSAPERFGGHASHIALHSTELRMACHPRRERCDGPRSKPASSATCV